MTILFPNSALVRVPERLVLAGGTWAQVDLKVRYGLFLHPKEGPVLLDTGYTTDLTESPSRSRTLSLYAKALRPKLLDAGQPRTVLERLGYTTDDVRWIVVTHFHADHICGLSQFPQARFITDGRVANRVVKRSRIGNLRHGVFLELLPADFSDRVHCISQCAVTPPELGLPEGRDLLGDGSLVSVALPGHAEGHLGILLSAQDERVFYAVDTQWSKDAFLAGRAPRYPSRLIADAPKDLDRSTDIVAKAMKRGLTTVLCHDPGSTRYDL